MTRARESARRRRRWEGDAGLHDCCSVQTLLSPFLAFHTLHNLENGVLEPRAVTPIIVRIGVKP